MFSTWDVTSTLKEFQILKHFGFWIFRLGMLNLYKDTSDTGGEPGLGKRELLFFFAC
jgi:hypothetical protein